MNITATLYTIGDPLAKAIKIPRQTIQSAIKRGAIGYWQLGCGTTVVDLADVQRWAVTWRKKGPPKLIKSAPAKGRKNAKPKK